MSKKSSQNANTVTCMYVNKCLVNATKFNFPNLTKTHEKNYRQKFI